MHPFVNTAIKAARRAGEVIQRASEQLDAIEIDTKGINNFVTGVDRNAEQEIIDILLKAYPSHGILAEESGLHQGSDEYQWIIDPLDGTTNFIHGYPHYCISIALKHKDRVEHAVIYDPVKNDLYTASRGAGAQKNERRIRVSKRFQLADCMVGTGLPSFGSKQKDNFYQTVRHLANHSRRIRLGGAAALDLAYVASGQLDSYLALGLSSWDMAAGSLLVKEAGGMCLDLKGGENFLEEGHIVAGNVKLLRQIFENLKNDFSDLLKS